MGFGSDVTTPLLKASSSHFQRNLMDDSIPRFMRHTTSNLALWVYTIVGRLKLLQLTRGPSGRRGGRDGGEGDSTAASDHNVQRLALGQHWPSKPELPNQCA